MNVFDASALLAYLKGEAGALAVEQVLENGGACSAANWSEVAQKIRSRGRNWTLARALLLGHHLVVEPVTAPDAEWAAARWQPGEGLSMGDRLCLALGHRMDADIWTADVAWGSAGRIRQIR